MSSFWTPSGEHRVPPTGDDSLDSGSGDADDIGPFLGDEDFDSHGGAPDAGPGFGLPGDVDPEAAAAMEEQLRQAQEQLLSVPASQIVSNHLIGLFELAALHLRVDPPNLEEARLPIDAMGLVVDNMGDQLHEGATLTAALQQIRMAYVEVHNQMNPDPED